MYEHLFKMTDSTGILQHSKYSVPDYSNGYTTDDNSRALIIACWLYAKTRCNRYLDLIYTYIGFMYNAQKRDGTFHNVMNYQRKFIDEVSSEDCFGRSIWALCFANYCSKYLPSGIIRLSEEMLEKSLQKVSELTYSRAKAYSLIGLTYAFRSGATEYSIPALRSGAQCAPYSELINSLTDDIIESFNKNRTDEWFWFEDIISYGNGIIPYAILRSYEITKEDAHLNFGLEVLNFLDGIVLNESYLKLIGCNGWYQKDDIPAEFDEQPIDTLDMILAYAKAYRITKNEKYLHQANVCYSWFKGNNSMKQCLINSENDGCYDGITQGGINRNQGAESQFAYIMSKLTIEQL